MMDTHDIQILKLLEEFDTKKSPSQRYLSKKLNISLGLVNSFLKRLAQKGYFKISTIPRSRVKYILTPKGALEKARLTYEYIQYSFNFYRDARHKIKQSLEELEENNIHDIVFFGMSDLAEITYVSLQETTMNLKAVVDDGEKGNMFLGHRVQSSDVLASMTFDKILITAISTSGNPVDSLLKMNINKKKIMLIQ
jgi:DNA-binding MarR family transcriptional regulator